jgi:hypothetical protein
LNRYTLQRRGAGAVSWPNDSGSLDGGADINFDVNDPDVRRVNEGVVDINFNVNDPDVRRVNEGGSLQDNTVRDWSRVGTALLAAGTATAIGVFGRLNAADQARAYQDNAAALNRLRNSFGFSNNPGAQSEYAQREELQRLMSQKSMNTMLYVAGGALLVLVLVYAVTRK